LKKEEFIEFLTETNKEIRVQQGDEEGISGAGARGTKRRGDSVARSQLIVCSQL